MPAETLTLPLLLSLLRLTRRRWGFGPRSWHGPEVRRHLGASSFWVSRRGSGRRAAPSEAAARALFEVAAPALFEVAAPAVFEVAAPALFEVATPAEPGSGSRA